MAIDSLSAAAFASPKEREAVFAALEDWLGNRFSQAPAQCEQHGHTLTWIENQPPEAVAFPHSADEVVRIVKLCAEKRVPIIAFGAGTSLEGHLNAPYGGLALDLSQMDRILRVNAEDMDCEVEAGVKRKALNESLRDTGLFFPVDPAADATLGGMASTRASGTNTVRYGTMRENVMNVTAVLANGEIVKTGQRARKSSAGYDLTRLFVGSEGTLGIITQLTLRLYGIPEAVVAAVCLFAELEGACKTAAAAIQLGLGVARIELLDALQIRISNLYSKLTLPEAPTLFLEFHGTPASHEGAGGDFLSAGGGEWRRAYIPRVDPGRARQALASPPRCLLGAAKLRGRQVRLCNRRLCADLKSRRLREGNTGRYRGIAPYRTHCGPCGRRQFPRSAACRFE